MRTHNPGSQRRPAWPGLVVAIGVSAACAVGSGGDGSFTSAASIGGDDGTASDPTEAADDDPDGDGTQGGSATSIGPADSDDPPTPGSEICNGFDDDGDGQIDEDMPSLTCGVGSCEVTVPSCEGGQEQTCTPALPGAEVCNGLDDDCNGTVDDGAEAACSTACGDGVEACVGGVAQACDAPQPQAEACNVADDDCDGSYDEGVGGCRLGVHRSLHPGTGEHFYTTDLNEAQCCGFNLEAQNFFRIYAGMHPGLVPFYRCLTSWDFHFYTLSPTCEGQTVEGVMGYVAEAAGTAGSIPLYRSFRAANGDHFYTISAAEHDNAVMNLDYVNEGIAAYVWN